MKVAIQIRNYSGIIISPKSNIHIFYCLLVSVSSKKSNFMKRESLSSYIILKIILFYLIFIIFSDELVLVYNFMRVQARTEPGLDTERLTGKT